MILWILLLLAQETHHGMPTPVMEPPPMLCDGGCMQKTFTCYGDTCTYDGPKMAVPDAAERDQELQEEWEDCFDADPVMEKYPMIVVWCYAMMRVLHLAK